MSQIREFDGADELRFADRVFQMRLNLASLGSAVLSGVNNFDPVAQADTEIVGLSAVAAATSVVFRWNPILAQNIRHYEVLVASTSSFEDGVLHTTTQPEYVDSEGGPDVIRYAKVRAVLADGSPQDWSQTINLSSGLLTTDSLEFAAALNYVVAAYGDGVNAYTAEGRPSAAGPDYRMETPSTMDAGGALSALYPAKVEITTIGGPVQIRATMTISYFFSAGVGIELSIMRDGELALFLGRIGYSLTNWMPGSVTAFIPGVALLEIPTPGLHTYELEFKVLGAGAGSVTVMKARMAALEYRR